MSVNSCGGASSGQRSKRSLNNSNSSNSNSKKSKQKTLGMVWGANSRSSSRSSFRNSPFSDFGSYMALKNRKLQNQFDAEASNSSCSGSSSRKSIFHGVSIFVDGFTIPSSQELRGYMLKYGGRFENYFSRHRVTHIICSNLPDSKVKNLRSFSGGLPVVKPAWILDSVVANKLLNWVPYQLDYLATDQPKLSAFFGLRSSPFSEDDSTVIGVKEKDGQCHEPEDKIAESTSGINSTTYLDVRVDEPSNSSIENEKRVNHEFRDGAHQLSASVSSYCLNNQNLKGSPSLAGSSNQRHSTLGDPNFVENYFKSSRLHFIGTWKNRYRKRFPSLSSECLSNSSNHIASDNSQRTTIIHVDMDCFFVSVVIRGHPELHDKPVAVCHSDNPKGTAEISSANYPARDYGVKAGIFVRDAKALCPHLIIFPYNFQAYEEVADHFYNILHKHCNKVQAVSCDEAFLDISDLESRDPELLASTIREEIFETTGCTASAGIAANMLMARLATRAAKPNGQFYIPPEKVDKYLNELPVKALPGIGHVLEDKLKKQNVWTCGQLYLIPKETLQKDFGTKTGEMLWNYSRGVDNRLVGVIQESKSIGAEVNWGVRFKDLQDIHCFFSNLCKEVTLRLEGCGMQGRTFTLKIKKRRKDAEEPTKYMGCGDCENLSHSITVPIATDNVEVIQRITKQLFGFFHLDVKEIRGVGLQVSKLKHANASKQGLERNFLKSWLASASASTLDQCNISVSKEKADSEVQNINGASGRFSSVEAHTYSLALPPLSHLDMGVVESLPPDLFSELNETYGGELADFIAQRKGKQNISSCKSSYEQLGVDEAGGSLITDTVSLNTKLVVNKPSTEREGHPVHVNVAESFNEAICTDSIGNTDLMPLSLTQVDTSVLQQLPEELRVDIVGLLPAHRRLDLRKNASLGSQIENPRDSLDKNTDSNNKLWIGNPPQWVDKFKFSNCFILNSLAEIYYKLGSIGNFPLILQRMISEHIHSLDERGDGWDNEATYWFSELLKQYIRLKIEFDIEEIYVCFRLIRRFTKKSKFFLQVYNLVFPHLQASFGEYYGGNLDISLNE